MIKILQILKSACCKKGCLEPLNSYFFKLVPAKTKIRRIATGFIFTEGPLWHQKQFLLFSDIPENTIWKLGNNGKPEVFRKPSYNANGLTLDNQGRLIICEHGSRCVTRIEHDGSRTLLADTYKGKQLNSPNDVIVKSDGAIYFTDPPYGITPEQQEQPFQGVYRIAPEGGGPILLTDAFSRPNGLAFSADEKKLYISNSEPERYIGVFDIRRDGTLYNGQIFQDMNINIPGHPDGMKLDRAGNIYCTGPGGIWVIDSHGNHLGTIVTPETPANCAWGDDDRQSLYITARTSIYKIRVNVPGI